MGSTTIALLNRMLPQGQEKAAVGIDSKKEQLDEAFAECMQQMSSQLNQMVSSASTSAEPELAVGVTDKAPAEQGTAEYDHYPCRSTKIKTYDESQERPDSLETAKAVETYGQDVKEAVMDCLGVTEDELEAAMANLGLTVLDLANPANLAALAAELIGAADVGDVLFHADFQQLMQEVGNFTADLSQKLQLPKEHLQELLAVEQPDEILSEQPIVLPEDIPLSPKQETAEVPQMQERAGVSGQVQEQEQQPQQELPVTDERLPKIQDGTTVRESVVQEAGPVEALSEKKPMEEQQISGDETGAELEHALAKTIVSVDNEGDSFSEQGDSPENRKSWFGQNATQHGQPETHVTAAANVENRIPIAPENVGQPLGYSSQIDTADVIRQIVEFTQIHTAERATTLEMQLNPEHLGKLYLELTSKEGVVTAKIYAQNELVREALEAQMADLKVNMNQAGIKVEAVEISAEPHAFEHNLEQQAKQEEHHAEENEKNFRKNRRINLNEMDDMDALSGLMSEEEALVAKIMADNGNSVDFMA